MKKILLSIVNFAVQYKWQIILGIWILLSPYMLTLHEQKNPVIMHSNVRESCEIRAEDRMYNYYDCRLIVEGWINSGEVEITYENQVTKEKYVMNLTAIGDVKKEVKVGKLEKGFNKRVDVCVKCTKGTDMDINIYVKGKRYGHEIALMEIWNWIPKFF